MTSSAFNSDDCALMSRALYQALQRLRAAGRIDRDEEEVRAELVQIIMKDARAGETDEEQLILGAMAQFQARPRHADRIMIRGELRQEPEV
jgi:hypothetical protein